MQAITQGHVDVVAVLVEHGSDVDEAGPSGIRALHHAASFGRADVIRLLCLKGADVDKLSRHGSTPLYLAAIGNFMDATQALLGVGADVSTRCGGDAVVSALHMVASEGHVEIARVLLEHGADANAACDDASTPLHTAAMAGNAEMVPLMCLTGANVDTFNDLGCTPLQLAVIRGNAAAVRALLAVGANASLRNDGSGLSALERAAKDGHVDVLRVMIEHGVEVNDAGEHSVTALLHCAAGANKAVAIEVLLGAGADIEVRVGGAHCTPLFVAVRLGSVSAVVILLKHGACVSKQNAIEQTPLHTAAGNAGRLGNAEVVDLLLRHGMDEKAISGDGQTRAGVVGSEIEEQDSLAEDVERVRQLLTKAPADRAWRRRRFLVLCRAHYPGGRVQLGQGSSHIDASIVERTRSCAAPSRAEAEWAGVASMLMGVGADPISLMGDGADIIFETIVGFL